MLFVLFEMTYLGDCRSNLNHPRRTIYGDFTAAACLKLTQLYSKFSFFYLKQIIFTDHWPFWPTRSSWPPRPNGTLIMNALHIILFMKIVRQNLVQVLADLIM